MDALETALSAVISLALLSLFLERASALVLEHELWLKFFYGADKAKLSAGIFKLALSICMVYTWKLDAVSWSLGSEKPNRLGYLLTAMILAQGTVGYQKLFHDILGVKTAALRNRQNGGS